MSDKLLALTAENFETVIAAGPVLVDFWAPWCAPCKAMMPLVEAVAADRAGELVVAQVNVDDQPALAGRFGVRGIPTLILFQDGAPLEHLVGQATRSAIDGMLKKVR